MKKPPPRGGGSGARMVQRIAPAAAAVVFAIALVQLASMTLTAAARPGALGIDWHCNANAARSWMAGDGYFLDRQLQGPYIAQTATTQDLGEVLYPPVALLLFVPFSMLPDIAWWIVPAVLTVAALLRLRPARWTWPVLALLFGLGARMIVAGNPTMWLVPASLWGLILGWPGVLVLLKPSACPLALAGITRRSWWVGLAVLVAVSLPFGHLWAQWVQVIVDQSVSSPLYSLGQWPLLVAPLVVWLGVREHRPQDADDRLGGARRLGRGRRGEAEVGPQPREVGLDGPVLGEGQDRPVGAHEVGEVGLLLRG